MNYYKRVKGQIMVWKFNNKKLTKQTVNQTAPGLTLQIARKNAIAWKPTWLNERSDEKCSSLRAALLTVDGWIDLMQPHSNLVHQSLWFLSGVIFKTQPNMQMVTIPLGDKTNLKNNKSSIWILLCCTNLFLGCNLM